MIPITSPAHTREPLSLRSSHGYVLSGVCHVPRGWGKKPAVLVLHGFCGYKDEPHIERFAAVLCEAGFVTLRFDAAGFGQSGGKPSRDFRISKYLDDSREMLRYLASRSDVDSSRVGICGHSLGGSLSVIAAAGDTAVRACSAVQPCTKITALDSIIDIQKWRTEGALEFESAAVSGQKFVLPWEFAQDADGLDASTSAPSVSCPLQLMYGTADVIVPPRNTLSIYGNAPRGTELVPLQDAGHDLNAEPRHLAEVSEKLVIFFRHRLEAVKSAPEAAKE